MHRFLDDVRIVEALNEPVDNSGSEGAKVFVNLGNVFLADFFSVNFHCSFLINFLYASTGIMCP
jgi:hypothetical protein